MTVGLDHDRWQQALERQSDYVQQLEQRVTNLEELNVLLRRQLAAANDYARELERQAGP